MNTATLDTTSLRSGPAGTARAIAHAPALRSADELGGALELHDQLFACAAATAELTAPRLRLLAKRHAAYALEFDEAELQSAPLQRLVDLMKTAPDEFALGLLAGAVMVRTAYGASALCGQDATLLATFTGYPGADAAGG